MASDQTPSDLVPWSGLPSVVLEHVVRLLSTKDRYSMSLVCRSWNASLLSARAWHLMEIHGRSFTVKDYTVLLGYHRRLDETKVSNCLHSVGQHIKRLAILPIDNYLHLHQLLKTLVTYRELLESLKEVHFSYACENRNRAGSFLHGMGLPILDTMMDFLDEYRSRIVSATLNNLMLSRENVFDFESKLLRCLPMVTRLELRNTTSDGLTLASLASLKSLRTLVTSPDQVNESLLMALAENGLETLHLVQDKFTGYAAPINRQTWLKVRLANSSLRVKLICCDYYKHDVLIQQGAPVSHVLYDTMYSVISPVTVSSLSSEYAQTLTVYGHKSLPKIHGRVNVHDRADSLLLLLMDNCPNLTTLIIRDRISSASVLLMARKCAKLETLYVRRNSILTRLDWSHDQNWSDEFYSWLKRNCKSMDLMEREVGTILGYGWRTMADGEYAQLSDVDL